MTKYSLFTVIATLFIALPLYGQAKYEREFRIAKSQFPDQALTWIEEELKDARRVRFYKEIDSARMSYEAKFKKDRLHYSAEFNSRGELEDIELLIREVDVPRDVYQAIEGHLTKDCGRHKIRRLQQQYPVTKEKKTEAVIKDAFQNLILPYINYELIVSCRTGSGRLEYEYIFNAEGSFISRRISIPPNYDHILY